MNARGSNPNPHYPYLLVPTTGLPTDPATGLPAPITGMTRGSDYPGPSWPGTSFPGAPPSPVTSFAAMATGVGSFFQPPWKNETNMPYHNVTSPYGFWIQPVDPVNNPTPTLYICDDNSPTGGASLYAGSYGGLYRFKLNSAANGWDQTGFFPINVGTQAPPSLDQGCRSITGRIENGRHSASPRATSGELARVCVPAPRPHSRLSPLPAPRPAQSCT